MIKCAYMQDESQIRPNVSHKIKVCYAITKGVWGGAGKYVYNLATSLPKDTYEVVVICGEGSALSEKLTSVGIRTE